MTLPEFCLIVRGSGERLFKLLCQRNCADYTFHLLPPTSLAHTRKIKTSCQGSLSETLSNSVASANIHHWRQKMGKLTNGIPVKHIRRWITNPLACPENLRALLQCPFSNREVWFIWQTSFEAEASPDALSSMADRGSGHTRLPGPTTEAEGEPYGTRPADFFLVSTCCWKTTALKRC